MEHLTNETSKLLQSNRNIETDYDDLVQKVSDIETKILENTNVYCVKKQELKNFEAARAQISHEQW